MSWLIFGGVVFFLMGLGLAADARGHARSALQWLPADRGSSLVRAYRLAGGAFMALGLLLVFGPSWIKPPVLDRAGRLGAGLLLLACGAGLAWAKRPELGGGARLPGAVERELGLSPELEPLGAAVSRWSSWALAAAFVLFGLWLLTRPDGLGLSEVRTEGARVADDDLGEAGRIEVEPRHAPDVVGGHRA